jgi:hypothetical protein
MPALLHEKRTDLLPGRTLWVISLANDFTQNLTLLISKVSEAVLPATKGNHIGPGATMDAFIARQPGVRLLINGGFSHYRKDFYDWPHQAYQVGDPVGVVKIRGHVYEDFRDLSHYGFFVQDEKRQPWKIIRAHALTKSEKYILGCTPLLIYAGQPLPLPDMRPLAQGQITPPSVLAHGQQNHPRTAIGIKGDKLCFIVVEGDDTQGGCTLPELQELGTKLELESLLNLDGGGSTQFRLWHEGRYISNHIAPEDAQRTLGHVLVVFDEGLKAR